MKRVAVLGKGSLAVHTCELVSDLDGWELAAVVPNAGEPDWDVRLTDAAPERWPDVPLVRSGDWRELLDGGYDLVISLLYNRIIGRQLIERCGRIVNCHPGRLPQYRGVQPGNWSLLNGERWHGVTLHEVDEGVDTGPILAQVLFPIWPEIDEVRDVWQRALTHGRQLLSDTLPRIDAIRGVPQDESLARTYYSREEPELGARRGWTRTSGPPWPQL